MAGKQALRTATVAVGFIFVWLLVVAPLWLDVDEGAVPPVDLALPPGARVTQINKQCASGGCWVEVSIDPGQDRSSSDTARALELSETQQCDVGGAPFFWTIWRWRAERAIHLAHSAIRFR